MFKLFNIKKKYKIFERLENVRLIDETTSEIYKLRKLKKLKNISNNDYNKKKKFLF
jgi:hypothetical protein